MIKYVDFEMTKVPEGFKPLLRELILKEEYFNEIVSFTVTQRLALEMCSNFSVADLAKQSKEDVDPAKRLFFEKAMRYTKTKNRKKDKETK